MSSGTTSCYRRACPSVCGFPSIRLLIVRAQLLLSGSISLLFDFKPHFVVPVHRFTAGNPTFPGAPVTPVGFAPIPMPPFPITAPSEAIPEVAAPGMAIVEELDQPILAHLRDGRLLYGSVPQYVPDPPCTTHRHLSPLTTPLSTFSGF